MTASSPLFRLLPLVVACSTPVPVAQAQPELSFTGLKLYQYDHGELVFVAEAQKAGGDRHHLALEGISVHHRGSKEVGPLDIKAATGNLDVANNGFLLEGQVSVLDGSGRTLYTDRAVYKPESKRFDLPGAVRVVSRDLNFTARGVEGLTEGEEITFKGPVEGSFLMQPKAGK